MINDKLLHKLPLQDWLNKKSNACTFIPVAHIRAIIVAIPAKITRSGHQVELKLYEHHFYKADWEEFDKLIEAA